MSRRVLIASLLAISMILTSTFGAGGQIYNSVAFAEEYETDSEDTRTGPSIHSRDEIVERLRNSSNYLDNDEFDVEPSAPNNPGELSAKSKENVIEMLNNIRYIAGLTPVSWDDNYGMLAQHAAFVNSSISRMTHRPDLDATKPEGMSDTVWNRGIEGASSSNIAVGYPNLNSAVIGWVQDLGTNNLEYVGHRMWALNPYMSATGFGRANSYYAMYAFNYNNSNVNVKNVVWPARYTPVEFFNKYVPWSLDTVDRFLWNVDDVTVKLTRRSTSPSGSGYWEFSSAKTYSTESEEFFALNVKKYYGSAGTYIVFRPDNIDYLPGDIFDVQVEGLGDTINYTVEFISGYPVESMEFESSEFNQLYLPEYNDYYLYDQFHLSPNIEPKVARNYKCEWTSSDESVLTVNENGGITFHGLGKAEVTATIGGNYTYTGTPMSRTTTVNVRKSLKDYDVALQYDEYYDYTGEPVVPDVTVKTKIGGEEVTLEKGRDYTISCKNNVNAGPSEFTITGIGNYTDTVTGDFRIRRLNLTSSPLNVKISELEDVIYNGKYHTPIPSVSIKLNGKDTTLRNNVDFSLEYMNNKDKGTATVTLVGKGNYYGELFSTFQIEGIWKRLAGTGRYDTMKAVVDEGFIEKGGTVVVAVGTGFKDALSASGFAGLYDAPIVLTDGKTLSTQASAVLSRLSPSRIILVGGQQAITSNVFNQIYSQTGKYPIRIAGANSASTSAELAKRGSGWSSEKVAIIATNKTFKDALSASPIAYAKKYPVLLADNGKSISNDVIIALKTLGIKKVVIVGGELAVSKNVESQLRVNGITSIERYGGVTAVETSQLIAKWGLRLGLTANKMGVATSMNYPDALSGAALCGHNNAILVLADDRNMLNAYFPSPYKSLIRRGYVFGGTVAVGNKTFAVLESSVQ